MKNMCKWINWTLVCSLVYKEECTAGTAVSLLTLVLSQSDLQIHKLPGNYVNGDPHYQLCHMNASQYTVRNSSCGKVMFSQATGVGGVPGRGSAWQGACVARGACVVGGVHGRLHMWQGEACMAGGMHGRGHVWQRDMCGRGTYMAGGGMHGRGVCVGGGMHGNGCVCLCGRGACMAGGMCVREPVWEEQEGMRDRRHGIYSERYASYWNAFLLEKIVPLPQAMFWLWII